MSPMWMNTSPGSTPPCRIIWTGASSVRWQQSMELLIADGVDTFVEIGPGRTLAGFLRKINREVKVYNVGTWEDVDKVVNELC